MHTLSYANFDVEGEIKLPVSWDKAQGLFHFKTGESDYYISTVLGYTITVGGTTYYTQFCSLNGKRVWHNSKAFIEGSSFLWHDGGQWVLSSCSGAGNKETWEVTEIDTGKGKYQGDTWYSCATLAGSYAARGILRGTVKDAFQGTPIAVTQNAISGWQKYNKTATGTEVLVDQTAPCGYYSPCGTQTGADKVLTKGQSSVVYVADTAIVRA